MKWEPFDDLDFFESRFLPSFPRLGRDLAVDVYEEEGYVMAKMSLPAINPDDIDVTIDDNLLTISGTREEEKETDKKDYYSKEIRRGSFCRTVDLPKSVDAQKAQADYKNGLLTVSMPVQKEQKGSSVKVAVKK